MLCIKMRVYLDVPIRLEAIRKCEPRNRPDAITAEGKEEEEETHQLVF